MMLKNKPIQTTDRVISVSGRVFYNDRRRRIDVKKPIRDLFESNQPVGYVMEFCLSEDKLLERAKDLSGKNILPVLLYFTDDEVEQNDEN